MSEKLYLKVPFNEKEEVKAIGGKWDWEKKQWFVADTTDKKLIEKWLIVDKSTRRAREGKQLTIELVPSTCWFSNVRNHVSKDDWGVVKKHTFSKAGYRCEICGGVGPDHPVECHEIWNYDDSNHIQTLEGTIALCPDCHRVKHIGLAQIHGVGQEAENWLAQINGWDRSFTSNYVDEAFEVWSERSIYDWSLNIDWLNSTFGFKVVAER